MLENVQDFQAWPPWLWMSVSKLSPRRNVWKECDKSVLINKLFIVSQCKNQTSTSLKRHNKITKIKSAISYFITFLYTLFTIETFQLVYLSTISTNGSHSHPSSAFTENIGFWKICEQCKAVYLKTIAVHNHSANLTTLTWKEKKKSFDKWVKQNDTQS